MSAAGAGARLNAWPSLCAVASFLAVIAAAWAILARIDVPDYGAWTGIGPLERKLDLYEAFAREGPVDAIVLGSSIVDTGFSARLYSELMSRRLDRPYRVFNFGVGGAEPRTLPAIYRFARMVARPREIIVMAPPEPRLRDDIGEQSPDYALMRSPAGRVLHDDRLLRASRLAWRTPLFKSAAAIREVVLTGGAREIAAAAGPASFAMDQHGDRVSYTLPESTAPLAAYKVQHQMAVKPFPGPMVRTPETLLRMRDRYFAAPDAAGLFELAELARRDGTRVMLLSHAGAATFWNGPRPNAEFEKGRADFFAAFAAALGATFHDAAAGVAIPVFGLGDTVHLNAYGAEVYTRAAFAVVSGNAPSRADPGDLRSLELPPTELLEEDRLKHRTGWALVRRPAAQPGALLRIHLLTGLAAPPLESGPGGVEIHTPEGRDFVAPCERWGASDLLAEVKLPAASRAQGILVRLLAGRDPDSPPLRNPIAAYEWVTGYPQEAPMVAQPPGAMRRAAYWALRFFMGEAAPRSVLTQVGPAPVPTGPVRLVALPPVRSAGDALYIAAKSLSAGRLELRLVAVARPDRAFDIGVLDSPNTGLQTRDLPHDVPAGLYRVEARDASGAVAGRSDEVRIDAR